ncbi:hypothetical protein [Psychroserpens sp. SPM9]|uniref:hypothetical protein n=1 Tax=Psychroserpens sp. SPM9 TaxID=2975598 RepID=UPI0021A8A835|nr:hypothetical protein [Psychroserpens sp. SPM9]MDG5490723.1 hypothetical protein [Psychroserpens sp. SPM9]
MKNLKNNKETVYYSTLFALLIAALLLVSCNNDDDSAPELEAWQIEVNQLRAAINPISAINDAMAAGWNIDATGYMPNMGHHYIKLELIDNVFEIEKPEALLFVPDENDVMQFVGVEYLVPIEDLDNPPPAPEGYTGTEDVWEISTMDSMWTLHVWIGLENPDGIFARLNMTLD